ncbi:hypothetical protein QYE76_017647 [Lolium multiflorum]|uniref:Retrotransposon gag domain-containing protein n=1 Tax=Lolium multiflorum TaxID=4521 RepID=A0AAD8V269_LOLMU|nr:hypothetical protein QYE76_017647 [Lolium multiflorum]
MVRNNMTLIRCPCRKCGLRQWIDPDSGQLEEHLLRRGFMLGFNEEPAANVGHEEEADIGREDEESPEHGVHHEEGEADEGDDDAGGDGGGDAESKQTPLTSALRDPHVQELLLKDTGNAKPEAKLAQMEVDGMTPLYPGCRPEDTRLSVTLECLEMKAEHKWTDSSFSDNMKSWHARLPKDNTLPTSIDEAKKVVCPLDLPHVKYHACINDCALFRNEYKDRTTCPVCGQGRYKRGNKKVPLKVVWYFPITPRLQRYFVDPKEAKLMQWHAEREKPADDPEKGKILTHPADASQWNALDIEFADEFGSEPRNIRLGMSTDGLNPFGNQSSTHSTWPVFVWPYNLPPGCALIRPKQILGIYAEGPIFPEYDGARRTRSFLDATIARSRQIENTETPNENAATPVNSPESVEYSSDDLDEDYVELDDDFIEKCNATTDARKIKKLLAEHAVRYKLSPDPKFATSPINIRDKDYDFSLDLSHIAIVEKTPFCGTEKESAVEHMTELSTLSGLFSDDVKMRTYFVAKIFPFSLKDDAKTWYNNLPPGSIKSPKELLDVFFRKYFPASAQHAALQRIYNFDQEDGEKLPEAWARFCSLIRAQPDHDLEKHDLLDIFYSGLTIESRAYLDSCAGCVFRKRTPDDAEELLAKIGRNHDDWSTPEPTPTPIVKKRGMIKLNDEDMREAKKSLKEKGIKPEDVKNLPPIEDLCEITPPSSMIEDPLYPEGHPKRVEQDYQLTKTSAPSKKKKKKHKNVVESSEPVNDPNSISISDAETESGNEHDKDNDKDDTPDKEEVEKEPEKPAKNKKYTKEDFITEKHGAVIDCNKGMVTFNVDDKEHTVYFPKRIDKKRKMKKFKFGELFKKGTTSTGRPSRASTQIRRSYNEDIIAPSFAPEEDNGAPNASSFPCYDFLTNAGILDDFFTLVNRAGLATYVGDEREQYHMLTKIFVESFKFHNTQYEPTVAFKIYGNPVTMELEEFCRALDIAPVGTARRIDDNPRDLLELYRGITEDDCRTIQRGKIRNIQLPAIKYFAYYIATSILGRENTSNISSYHLAFLNAALTGQTPYHLGSLIARRLSSRGPIFGGTIALRILTHLRLPLDSNDVPLTPRRLDIAAMKSHHFVTTDSTIDNMVYRMLFADGNEKEIPLPQPGLFNIDRQSWSLTKEEVEEHMKIQEFHQQHDSENAEPSYDCTVTYPDVSSSTYLEPGRSSSYYGDTTSWGPWE